MKKIRLVVSTGFVGSDHQKTIPIPDDWDEMSEGEQEQYLDEEAEAFLHDRISFYGEVIGEDDGDTGLWDKH